MSGATAHDHPPLHPRRNGAGHPAPPVGRAWTVARIEAPGIRLHQPGRPHPTAAGSYLAALLSCQIIAGRPAANAPAVIVGTPRNSSEPAALVNLPWSGAVMLQTIASRAFEQEPPRPTQSARQRRPARPPASTSAQPGVKILTKRRTVRGVK